MATQFTLFFYHDREAMQTFTEQINLATLLKYANQDGAVLIRRADGQSYTLRPQVQEPQSTPARSPLDVPGIDTGLTAEEIVELIHEGRGNHRW